MRFLSHRLEVGVPPTIWSMSERLQGTCPVCQQGDLISISMIVSGSDLSFTTCHLCEAKWWHRDGATVPLRSVVDGVISQRA
jgi:formate dehydrogenase maturation protein FdhE